MARMLERKKSWFSMILMCLVLFCAALTLVGCRSAADLPPAEQAVLQGMRDIGFKFDSTLVKVTGEESQQQAVVTGPMTGLKDIPAFGEKVPPKASDNYARYVEVVLELDGDQWVVVDATLNDKQ